MTQPSNLKTSTQSNLQEEIIHFVRSRKTLQLCSIDPQGHPYASYAPFAIGEQCLYVLLSDIALHAINLRANPQASVLILEDEDTADEVFARIRVNYRIIAEPIAVDSVDWRTGVDTLRQRHGNRIDNLSQLRDFHLFRLAPQGGRYVKGFGRAYDFPAGTLNGAGITHLRDGHQPRDSAA